MSKEGISFTEGDMVMLKGQNHRSACATIKTLQRRIKYKGRKGKRAERRITLGLHAPITMNGIYHIGKVTHGTAPLTYHE